MEPATEKVEGQEDRFMSEKDRSNTSRKESPAVWQKPTLQRVGDVGNVFKMPGGGKLSLLADDSGDSNRKPKGQE
jgi:hypothetical protein